MIESVQKYDSKFLSDTFPVYKLVLKKNSKNPHTGPVHLKYRDRGPLREVPLYLEYFLFTCNPKIQNLALYDPLLIEALRILE